MNGDVTHDPTGEQDLLDYFEVLPIIEIWHGMINSWMNRSTQYWVNWTFVSVCSVCFGWKRSMVLRQCLCISRCLWLHCSTFHFLKGINKLLPSLVCVSVFVRVFVLVCVHAYVSVWVYLRERGRRKSPWMAPVSPLHTVKWEGLGFPSLSLFLRHSAQLVTVRLSRWRGSLAETRGH